MKNNWSEVDTPFHEKRQALAKVESVIRGLLAVSE